MYIKKHLSIVLLISAFVFSYLVVVFTGFPYFGTGVVLASIALFVYISRDSVNRFDRLLFFLILLLSLCVAFRSQGFLTFLNISAVLLLGAFFIKPKTDKLISFLVLAFSPLTSFLRLLDIKSNYSFNPTVAIKGKVYLHKDSLSVGVISAILSVGLLVIIVPLLASSNPLFEKLITDYLDIARLIDWLVPKDFVTWLIRIIVFLLFAFFLPRIVTYANSEPSEQSLDEPLHFEKYFLLPKIVVAITIALFFVTQIQLYFSSEQTLQALGYSLSQYAREVFAQLTIVSIIIIGLLYNDKNRSHWSRIMTYILIVEGLFLALMALKSVFDYSSAWGFTQKRLWGYTGILWIIPVLGYYSYCYYYNLRNNRFVKAVILYSTSILLFVNFINFDALIYHVRPSSTQQGVDYSYLVDLSPDSYAYADMWRDLQDDGNNLSSVYSITPRERLYYKIVALRDKYEHFDLRTFNFSEYMQYLQIASLEMKWDGQPAPVSTGQPTQFMQTPVPIPEGKQADGSTIVKTKYRYTIALPNTWQVTNSLASGELRIDRCGGGMPSDTCIAQSMGSITFGQLDEFLGADVRTPSVENWVKTELPAQWYDWSVNASVPYTDEVIVLPAGNGVRRTSKLSATPYDEVYLPYRNQVLRVRASYGSAVSVDTTVFNEEVRRILQSYKVY